MALVVSYSKAFKMKNIVISTIEQYEGHACDKSTSACAERIKEQAEELGFKPNPFKCESGFTSMDNLYCFKYENDTISGGKKVVIETTVDVHFPIVSEILSFDVFRVTGESRVLSTD